MLGAERLVIISPHWEGMRVEFARAFSVWYEAKFGEEVEVDWRDLGGTSDDLQFVVSEFKQRPEGIGIDLFFGGGIDPFYSLAKQDLLQPYQPPPAVLKRIPKSISGVPIYDPQFRWFGVALSSFGILYNKRVLDLNGWPRLDTWRALAEQAPVGSVGSGDPRDSGSTHMVYELILQRYGWDEGWGIMRMLAAKCRGFDRASTTTAKDVTTGNTAYGLTIDFYAFTQIAYAGPENAGFVLPGDCEVVNPDAIALLRGAPNRTVAERFIEFAISEPGQKLLMVPRGQSGGADKFSIERMSILPDMYDRYHSVTLVPINPFAQRMSFEYDPKKGSNRWGILNSLFGATIIDVHPELVAAWKHIERAGLDPASVRRFCAPPLSEADALALAAGQWRDPSFRFRQEIQWQREARREFLALAGDRP